MRDGVLSSSRLTIRIGDKLRLMKVTAVPAPFSETGADVLIVPIFEEDLPQEALLARLNEQTRGAVASVFESGEVDGKPHRWALLYTDNHSNSGRVLLYGAGKLRDASPLSLQRVAGGAIRTLSAKGVKTAAFLLRDKIETDHNVRAIVEGAMLGAMDGDLYRSNGRPAREVETLLLVSESIGSSLSEGVIEAATIMAEATNFARWLGNEPGNVMTPTVLANRAQEMAAHEGLGVEVLGEEEMKQLGMGALLAVARGSEETARLIILSYEPDTAAGKQADGDVIALVGKGITFDSGGISIKPAEKMDEMKFDMGGGAAVIGAMQALARLRPAARVLGLIPAAENMPSGRSYKPGDVVRSFSGKTIEVVNTDAEGRLILADAITYAINQGATHIVDAATLTGACVVALGEVRAAVIGNDQRLVDELIRSGERCGERLWQLPADKEYGEMIRSDIADVKNIGNRTAGAITAAMFIKMFADSVSWAHLDIAGTAWLEREKPYMPKGATGFGVRLLANFVLENCSGSQGAI